MSNCVRLLSQPKLYTILEVLFCSFWPEKGCCLNSGTCVNIYCNKRRTLKNIPSVESWRSICIIYTYYVRSSSKVKLCFWSHLWALLKFRSTRTIKSPFVSTQSMILQVSSSPVLQAYSQALSCENFKVQPSVNLLKVYHHKICEMLQPHCILFFYMFNFFNSDQIMCYFSSLNFKREILDLVHNFCA